MNQRRQKAVKGKESLDGGAKDGGGNGDSGGLKARV